jgi:hypothetical protein
MRPAVHRAIVFLAVSCAAACGSAPAAEVRSEPPVTAEDRPYMHACAPDGSGQACNVDECVAWKRDHGESEDDALAECLQDCNCGE